MYHKSFIETLQMAIPYFQRFHWNTVSLAVHEATGEFLKDYIEKLDEFVEACMAYKIDVLWPVNERIDGSYVYEDGEILYALALRKFIQENREDWEFSTGIASLLDDLENIINTFVYKTRFIR